MKRLGTIVLIFVLFGSIKVIERSAERSFVGAVFESASDLHLCIDCHPSDEHKEIQYAVDQIKTCLAQIDEYQLPSVTHIDASEYVALIEPEAGSAQLDGMLDKLKKLYLLKRLILQKPKDIHYYVPDPVSSSYLIPFSIDALPAQTTVQVFGKHVADLSIHERIFIQKKYQKHLILKKLLLAQSNQISRLEGVFAIHMGVC